MDAFDLIFEEIVYRHHPEVSGYSVVKEQKTKKRFLYKITVYLDMNLVDLNLSDDIIIEDYHLVGPEYDYETSEYIYDMIRTNVRDTITKSVRLIGVEPHICNVNVICQF